MACSEAVADSIYYSLTRRNRLARLTTRWTEPAPRGSPER